LKLIGLVAAVSRTTSDMSRVNSPLGGKTTKDMFQADNSEPEASPWSKLAITWNQVSQPFWPVAAHAKKGKPARPGEECLDIRIVVAMSSVLGGGTWLDCIGG
jgi:hypothetical protein